MNKKGGKISLLVPVRPDSALISRFIAEYCGKTFGDTELLLMISSQDTQNGVFFDQCRKKGIRIFVENASYGQKGHHVYINELAKYATGDWILTLCDDVRIIKEGWDNHLREVIDDVDSQKVYCVIPQLMVNGDNFFMISRGWYETVGRVFGYPNGDSWLGYVIRYIGEPYNNNREVYKDGRVIRSKDVLFEVLDSKDLGETYIGGEEGYNRIILNRQEIELEYGDWLNPVLDAAMKEEGLKLKDAISKGK